VILDEPGGEDWTSRNLQKLLAGRLDAVYERNRYTLVYQAVVDSVEDKIKVLSIPAEPIGHYFVFHRTSSQGAELLKLCEQAVGGWEFDYEARVQVEIRHVREKAKR